MLTVITAGAHLYLAAQPDENLRFWFFLNGMGYLMLLVLYFLPSLATKRNFIRLALLGYVILTVVLWFFLGSPSEGKIDPFDVVVKCVEVTLAVNLFFDIKQQKTRGKKR